MLTGKEVGQGKTIQEMWDTIVKLETKFFSSEGTHKSDLSAFVAHDLSKIMTHLHNNEFIRKMTERESQKARQDGYPIRMPGDFVLLQQEDMTVNFITDRPETGNFTTLDMIHTKQELMRKIDTLATFLALKTSSELTLSIPAQNIRNH